MAALEKKMKRWALSGYSWPFQSYNVDRILDKLSRTGINSLTPEEVAVLEKVREQMNRKN